MLLLIYSFFRYICTRFHYLLSLDNDVLETSKRRAMFYNILSQNFIVKCFTKSLLIKIKLELYFYFQIPQDINLTIIRHTRKGLSCRVRPKQAHNKQERTLKQSEHLLRKHCFCPSTKATQENDNTIPQCRSHKF